MGEKLLLRLPDLAAQLSISVRTLKRWRAEGLVPEPVHLPGGRGFGWPTEQIRQWIAAGMPPPERQEAGTS